MEISSFKTGDDWFIDNRWTDEEKIALGFKEQTNAMTVSEMQLFLETVIEEITNYKEELSCLIE